MTNGRELLADSGACVAPVQSIHEASYYLHNVARPTFIDAQGVMVPEHVPRFGARDNSVPPAPVSDAVAVTQLRLRAGFGPGEIDQLRERAVLG